MNRRATALLVIGLLLTAGVVLAQHDRVFVHGRHGGPGGPDHHAMMVAHLTELLDLTAEQQASAKDLHEAARAKAEPLRAEAERLQGELEKAFDSNAPAATVGELAIALHKTHEQIKAVHEEAMTSFHALLTAEQLEKLKKLHEEHPMLNRIHKMDASDAAE